MDQVFLGGISEKPGFIYFSLEKALSCNLNLNSSWNVPGVDTMPFKYNRYGGMGNGDSEEEQASIHRTGWEW